MNKNTRIHFNVNPQYRSAFPDWALCSDSLSGERRIKECGELYLPMTEGQMADKVYGRRRYESYKNRACYFPYFSSTVFSMLGLLHREGPEAVELPERLLPMLEHFSSDGTSLEENLHRINYLQLAYGRCGLLLDAPANDERASAVPVVSLYPPQRILDWNCDPEGRLCFLLLDESHEEFDPVSKHRFTLELYRVCMLNEQGHYYSLRMNPAEYAAFDLDQKVPDAACPLIGGRMLDQIPFVFVNTSDTDSGINPPPLLPLANIALAIYRGEADYRHALFMQGQSTLFLKGFPLETAPMMGAGNFIHTDSPDAEGRFLEVSGAGLAEMRSALSDLHTRAMDLGLSLDHLSGKASGDALKTRLGIRTALLRTIALSAEAAFQHIFRLAALWCGIPETGIVFRTNKDFSDVSASAEEALQLLNAKNAGMPLSDRSIHEWLRKNDFTNSSYEKDLAEIGEEKQNV